MKEWTETEENTALLFEFYEGVIYNVLQRINLTKKNPSFDDFVQEGRILLLECYQETTGKPLGNISERNQFGSYFKRKLYWSYLHTITKKNLETVALTPEWMTGTMEDEHWFEVEDTYHDFFTTLTPNQLKTLEWMIGSNETVKLYAIRLGRSRRAIEQEISTIRKKLKKFLEEHSI